jgi:methyltransferase OMS1
VGGKRRRRRRRKKRGMLRTILTTGLAASTASLGLAVGYGVALGPPPRCCGGGCLPGDGDGGGREDVEKKRNDRLAKTFDEELNFHEFFTGIDFLRSRLVRRIDGRGGDVLEVMCGTGRNLDKYSSSSSMEKMRRLVMTDASEAMVNEAREKIRGTTSNGTEIKAEVDDATKMKQKSNSFDYVVMTFGLCSTDEPEKVVKELARVTKPNGEILLLEHGRPRKGSVHDYWLSNILDAHVDMHQKKWGCAWNKDIEKIVRESVEDVCDVVTFDRWHFGTTSYVVLRKRE